MINVVILAAGLGKRMHSSLPKVLQPLAGRPMISHVLSAVQTVKDVAKTVVVVGHKAEEVKAALAGVDNVEYALQEPQLGTGHALQQALPLLDPAAETTLVLLGDVPLIQPETIERLRDAAGDGMQSYGVRPDSASTGPHRCHRGAEGCYGRTKADS